MGRKERRGGGGTRDEIIEDFSPSLQRKRKNKKVHDENYFILYIHQDVTLQEKEK